MQFQCFGTLEDGQGDIHWYSMADHKLQFTQPCSLPMPLDCVATRLGIVFVYYDSLTIVHRETGQPLQSPQVSPLCFF